MSGVGTMVQTTLRGGERPGETRAISTQALASWGELRRGKA